MTTLCRVIVAYTVPKLKDYSQAMIKSAFADLRKSFDDDVQDLRCELEALSHTMDGKAESEAETAWKRFRDIWQARTSGILTQINDLWVRNSPKEVTPLVGSEL